MKVKTKIKAGLTSSDTTPTEEVKVKAGNIVTTGDIFG